ncbi:MAG: nucleotidyltransferase domain-containing protein [Candidatus Bipolaricaulota bacterium]|nr:nucleotidyltransferase domain-containing protein [Candidatus Bipolaricaulota bacterium]MCS7275090.1 nucleotidyltransferase domain-containing protein [Candidatus Bipolaricaulota bacterium]MDW8110418.1 nucleotidyltransferase domain-containing protein [Candidatus Bipolaricaulota bacterium]MDW8329730.1 nucleotidyltransferase domain-containing protein [Candidatus Bipolaricaulota bacterium]
MPVRSLSSSVLRWPDARTVDQVVRRWAEQIAQQHPEVRRIGYFGSYARGDWGVGSDLDTIVIVEHSQEPFIRRAACWDTLDLPVPVDLLIYTLSEWQRCSLRLREKIVWVYPPTNSFSHRCLR